MTTATTHERAPDTSVLAWTGGIALVWLIAAFLRPDTTLHLGPLLLPLVPALLGRGSERAIGMTVAGIAAGVASILVLFTTGNLSGPSLEPFPSALTESIVFLAVGGLIGFIVAASAGNRASQ